MGLAIKYTTPCDNMRKEVDWCNAQGWRHIVDWRWFWDNSNAHSATYQNAIFHFEDDRHAHWFLLAWGGEITSKI